MILKLFHVKARSWEGRIPLNHDFKMSAENYEEALLIIEQQWPGLYNVECNEIKNTEK